MKVGHAIGLEYLASRLWRPTITITPADGVLWLSDGSRKLAIVDRRRATLYKRGIHVRLRRLAQYYALDRLVEVRQGDEVLNCGANIGEVAILLAERGCKVIAVEPDPKTLLCLAANAGAWPSIRILPIGLWNADRELTFYQKPESADTSAVNDFGDPVTVNVKRLDSLNLGRVKLLVGDAEGAEPEVFEGGTETLRRTEYVSFDCGPERHGAMTADRCSTILKGLDFDILDVDKEGRLVARNRSTDRRQS